MPSPFFIPLNALRAIEIVARRGALSPAAEELGVTPGAVSQHIRRAEERLGIQLFERTPRGLVPTPELADQLPRLTEGFDHLATGLAGLRPDAETRAIDNGFGGAYSDSGSDFASSVACGARSAATLRSASGTDTEPIATGHPFAMRCAGTSGNSPVSRSSPGYSPGSGSPAASGRRSPASP